MNKGMFYLLPFVALTQVAASNAFSTIEVAGLYTGEKNVSNVEASKPLSPEVKHIAGRNTANPKALIILRPGSENKPRAGRNNASYFKGRLLKKRR